jgi:hypothetical protein
MGWDRIDPATGMPLESSAWELSRPPEFVLLNAVPGVDDDEACYLGDGPWGMACTLPNEVAEAAGPDRAWTPEAVRAPFLGDAPPCPPGGAGSPSTPSGIREILAEPG